MDNYILNAQHITKEFPGVKALYDVSLDLLQGEVHALVGENGAGKSTLIKILAGAYKMDSGKIIFNGNHIDFNNPKEALDQGISAVYQELSLISHFSVTENMFLGKEKIKKVTKLINWSTMKKRTQEVLDQYGIKVDADRLVKDLPIGQRQMIEIVIRVFWKAKLIIMDEPTTSLDGNEVDKLFSMIKYLKNNGVTVLYISHRLDEIFHIADNVTILKNGEKVGTYNIEK
jgi:ribose transport system ATP-binding protein